MHPIRGGFRDEQAAPECRGCCKTSGPHWRLEVSCSPPGKHHLSSVGPVTAVALVAFTASCLVFLQETCQPILL